MEALQADPRAKRLYDQYLGRLVVAEDIPVAGATPEDLLEFCTAGNVNFFSLASYNEGPPLKVVPGLFRVGTFDFPSRGLDVRWEAFETWLAARPIREAERLVEKARLNALASARESLRSGWRLTSRERLAVLMLLEQYLKEEAP